MTGALVGALETGAFVGHAFFVLHACEATPEQPTPPCAGAGSVHVRVCVPPPHVFEQSPKPLHPPSSGHLCSLQGSELFPSHALPPPAGDGLLHDRVFVPPLHFFEHSLKPVQPPSTASYTASGWFVL